MATLSDETVSRIQAAGLGQPLKNNKRKISPTLLGGPGPTMTPPASVTSTDEARSLSPEAAQSTPTITIASFKSARSYEEVEYVEVPSTLDSQETYEFLGFTPAMAATLWETYISLDPRDPQGGFIDLAIERIRQVHYLLADGLTDEEALIKVELNEEMRTVILLPEYEHLRGTAPLDFWIETTFQSRYRALSELDEKARVELARIEHKKKKRASAGAKLGLTLPAPPQAPGPAVGAEPLPPAEVGPAQPPPEVSTQSATSPVTLEGHTMLWRGGDFQSICVFYNKDTGDIDFNTVHNSSYVGDFNGRSRVIYFTPQREVADQYADWAKKRNHIEGVAVIQIAVPNAFLDTLSIRRLVFGEEWRIQIWHGRRGKDVPKKLLVPGYTKADLWIGDIASGKHKKFEAMKTPDEIKESHVLKLNIGGTEVKAEQWVFKTRRGREGFEEACKGKGVIFRLGCQKVPVRKA